MAKRKKNDLDEQIGREWHRLASGVQVSIMDIPAIFRECRAAMASGVSLETSIQACIVKYRRN